MVTHIGNVICDCNGPFSLQLSARWDLCGLDFEVCKDVGLEAHGKWVTNKLINLET